MAASFSAWAPAFLQHKADSELEREEALGLARLLQATHPDDVGEAQTSPALRLAQNVLGHLLEALDDAADHLADAEARAEHFESVASRAHDAAARAAPPVAENAENAGDSANVERVVVPDHASEVRKQLQRRLLDAEQELAHARQYAADAEAHARDLVSANAALVAQRDALEATAHSTIAPETNDAPSSKAFFRRDVRTKDTTKDTSDAQQQTDAPALPFVDPNLLVDPVQAAAMIAEAKATSAAAHAAVRAEMESRRAFAAECASSVRAALAVNESLEKQLVEAVAARRAAETRMGACVSEARRWEKALEKHRAFDALRRATEARRPRKERAERERRKEGAFQSEKYAEGADSEVLRELASAAVQCQRRRRGALGRREARAYRDAILAEDRAEWAAEERDAAIVVQSAFRGHAARRDAAAAAAAATRVQSAYRGHRDRREVQGSKDARIVASLVQGIVEGVVEATDGAERTSAVTTLVRESLARVVARRADADDFSDDETSVL